MPTWTGVTFGYALYLAALAWLLPRFARARAAASVTALLAGALWWSWPALVTLSDLAAPVVWVVVPSLALLGSYRVSGLFFVRASLPLEQRLLAWDAVLLHRSGVLRAYYASRPIVRELFELFYLLVYATVPLGATGTADRRPAGSRSGVVLDAGVRRRTGVLCSPPVAADASAAGNRTGAGGRRPEPCSA